MRIERLIIFTELKVTFHHNFKIQVMVFVRDHPRFVIASSWKQPVMLTVFFKIALYRAFGYCHQNLLKSFFICFLTCFSAFSTWSPATLGVKNYVLFSNFNTSETLYVSHNWISNWYPEFIRLPILGDNEISISDVPSEQWRCQTQAVQFNRNIYGTFRLRF